MKKWILFGIACLGLWFIARPVLIAKIAPRLFERAVAENIGVDHSVSLADGLHVYICGAGSPLPDPKRGGACMGILAGDMAFIVDIGSNGIRNLSRMGFPVAKVDHIYLTHNHSDHFDGLGEAMLVTWMQSGREAPLSVSGPPGTEAIVTGFNRAYAGDARNRIAHHGTEVANPKGFGGQGIDIDLRRGTKIIYDDGTLKITAATVSHAPIDPAYGFRIDYKDRSVFISGDTAYDPNISTYARDVDVLFHEALNRKMVGTMEAAARKRGNPRLAKVMQDILTYHASPVEAARTAYDAEAKALVIYHSIPPLPIDALKPMWSHGMDKAYNGKITISEDGTVIRLPVDSGDILYERGF